MTRDEFKLAWDVVDRRSSSFLWSLYICVWISMVLTFTAAIVFIGFSLASKSVPVEWHILQVRALFVAAASGVVIATKPVLWNAWDAWIKRMGLKCPSCGHNLIFHTGEQTQTGCTNCGGKCRTTPTTGLCDKCGYRIFDA